MSVRAAQPDVTWREIGALFLLPFGSLAVPVVGWFAGVLLLWSSDAWTTRDKLVGTLVIPGGILAPVMLFAFVGTSAAGVVLLVLLLLAPLVADGYLVWRLRAGVRAY